MRLVILFCFLCSGVVGQTVEIESAFINKSISEKKWDVTETTTRGKMWQQVRKEYPVLPYDTTTREIKIVDIITFPGISKEAAYRRAKEWAALNFGKLAAVTEYENEASGKIILEGFSKIHYTGRTPNLWGKLRASPEKIDLYYSLVLTFKEGKAKIQYKNIQFKSFVPGYSTATFYVPGEIVTTSFEQMFPIVSHDPDSWEVYFDLLKQSVAEFKATAPSLEAYIKGQDEDYRF